MHTLFTSSVLVACAATLTLPLGTAEATPVVANADDLTTSTPIKHLVVVFQENASFDHYFGTYPNAANLRGDPPFDALPGTPVVNNLLPSPLNGNRDLRATNPNQSKPFRLDRSQFVTCSQDHAYRPEQRATNGGAMNRFVQQTDKSNCDDLPRPVPSPQVMGYFDGNTVTALWNYAQHFTLNDNAFATTYGPSTPGALNLVAGRTSGASPDNGKTVAEGVVYGDPDPLHDTCSDPTKTAELTGTNVGDLLTGAGVSWGWFQGGFRLDPSEDPAVACMEGHENLAGIEDEDYEPHHNPFQYFASTANEQHLPPTSVAAIGHDDQAKHQYDLRDFWAAAESGNLPAVSFLKAAGYQDGHPGPPNSNPLDEQDFLVDTLNRLQQLPEWSSTAVILAWDDSDGWYDHQFPPNVRHSHNPDLDTLYGVGSPADLTTLMCMAPNKQSLPINDASVFEMRCGYGERLPFLIVSPFVQANHVDHTEIDQASILRFIEENWGLGQLGQGSFDAASGPYATGSLLGMFDFDQTRHDTLILNHFTGNPDRPPSLAQPSVTPEHPTTNDTLTVSASATDPDLDPTNPGRQDTVRLSYEWFNGDSRLAETGSSLDLSAPGNGDHGDAVTVRVTAIDELGVSTSQMTTPIVIGNSAPTIDVGAASASVTYSDALAPIPVVVSDADGDDLTVGAVGLPEGISVSRSGDGGWQLGGTDQAGAGEYVATLRVSDGALTRETPLDVTVQRESAHVGYAGDLLISTGSATASTASVMLRAKVTQEQDGAPGDLTRADVLFDMYGPSNTSGIPDATYVASPTADGDASVLIPSLPIGTWTVVVRTDPDAGYFTAPDSDVVPISVYTPTTGNFVTGGGWVPDSGHGLFGLEARHRKDGAPSGNVTYAFSDASGHQYVVRSTAWRGGGLAISGAHATMAGTCDVTVLDSSGDVLSTSRENTFRLDVADLGKDDTFALSVYTPDGTLFHRVGTPTAPVAIGGGQVVIHH